MQKYLTLIIAALIAYNLLEKTSHTHFKQPSESTNEAVKPKAVLEPKATPIDEEKFQGTWLEKKIAKIMVNFANTPEGEKFLKNLIQPMGELPKNDLDFKINNKELIYSMFNVNILTSGIGSEASCGSHVKFNYHIYDLNGQSLKEGLEELNIGEGKLNKAIENSIIGMRPNEEREAIIYPNIIKDSNLKAPIKVKLKLEKLESKVNSLEIKKFDEVISFAKPFLCGEKVKFDIKIMDITGREIFNKQTLKVSIGSSKTPIALTEGLFNKTSVGSRTLLAQGESFISLEGISSNKIEIAPNQCYIIELSNTEAIEDK